MFVHHVFFWLQDGLDTSEIKRFEEGVKSLLTIEHIKFGDVAKPAKTNRPVIDNTYSYSLLLVFENEAQHDQYQPHPTHKKFIETFSPLYKKVLIYDSDTI